MSAATLAPAEWNNTRTAYPRDLTIHALFEEQARLRPATAALVFDGGELTYGELNSRANRLAHYLRRLGVAPDALVGVCLERSPDLIVALLAILKAGGAYVPFDPNYPRERLEFMLADSQVRVMIAAGHLRTGIPGTLRNVDLVCMDDLPLEPETPDSTSTTGPRNLAYAMYTSGSTGQPKGVLVEHRSVVRLVKNTNYCRFGPDEVFFQFAPISFDASTFEIWGALLNGGRLAIMQPGTPSLEELGCAIRRHHVTTLWLTAGLFHLMVDQRLDDLRPVRQLLAGGDVLSAPHIRKVLDTIPSCTVINGYGPTEGTTFTCCHAMRAGDAIPDSVPIGKPISNTRAYILDDSLQPVPAGEPGELCAGGDGLARGYLDRPDLTAEKFVASPFEDQPVEDQPVEDQAGSRLYRTGDLARYRSDGAIEFLGRSDGQIKILGYRIELGEIEATLLQHPDVAQACVAAHSGASGEKRLAAYVVPRPESAASPSLLRGYLQERLPHYMTPSSFVMMEGLPLSPNGKVDRSALPNPAPTASANTAEAQDTIEEAIAAIWRKVLHAGAVGLDDNFFDLGGDSLMLLDAHAEIQKSTKRNLSIVDLFESPTVRSLAKRLAQDLPAPSSGSEEEERARKQREAQARQRQLNAERCR